jgi:hypothetical protein
MLKRSEMAGSLMDVSLAEEHFALRSNTLWICSQNVSSVAASEGVKKMCRPGETRDVKGGVEV